MPTTRIEWTDATWNPVTGCTPVSAGCARCYADRMAKRLHGRYGYDDLKPFRPGTIHRDKLDLPVWWTKSRRIFVCSMGDLFHEAVSDATIRDVFRVCELCLWHTFVFCTKRPERMAALWPKDLPNAWALTSCEDQATFYERVPHLLRVPAVVRGVSLEPLLGPIDLTVVMRKIPHPEVISNGITFYPDSVTITKISWVIVGGETGPGARPMDPDWARSVRDQCAETGVPFFLKKLTGGGRILDERTHEEFPR